jgi:hypothetical protein
VAEGGPLNQKKAKALRREMQYDPNEKRKYATQSFQKQVMVGKKISIVTKQTITNTTGRLAYQEAKKILRRDNAQKSGN